MVFGRHCRGDGSRDTQWQVPLEGEDDKCIKPTRRLVVDADRDVCVQSRFLTKHFLMVLGGRSLGAIPNTAMASRAHDSEICCTTKRACQS